jgi:hypothetical protein
MAQNLDNFAEALKIDYLPVVREQLNNANVLFNRVKRNERDVVGKQWQTTAHYYRNSGVGAGSETGLPTAGQQKYKNPYGTVKYQRGRIQLTGPTIEAAKNDRGSMVRALESEIKGVVTDLKKDINFQAMNDGTAARALVNGDPATGTTLTLDTPGTQYLSDGMLIDIVDPTTGVPTTSGTDLTVSTVDSSTEVTMSAGLNADVADDDLVVRANSTDDAGTSYEMMGLKGIVDDATYVTTLHNLSRSSFAWWKCSTYTNDDNSGTLRDLSLPLIQNGISAVEKNGGTTDLIISDHDMRDAYAALVIADKRFPNTLNLDGGFKALEYNEIPWVADKDCPPNTIFFLDTSHLEFMQMSDWNWMDKDGAVLSRVSGSDAYEAVTYWYVDFTTDRPLAHTFLRDVQ